MQARLKAAFKAELDKGKELLASGAYEQAFYHLERAHILGQRNYVTHVISHYWMLRVGLKAGDIQEVFGQVIRIVGSAGSLIGKVPLGNSGRANVSPVKPMPIPEDLKQYFE